MSRENLTEEDALYIRGICVGSFDRNRELANDCFLYVWEKLHEEGSRRIKTFKGNSSFRTYLFSVTSRLVIDFRRSRFGTRALPKYFWEFDEINRRVFKLFFYQRVESAWAENSIKAEFQIPAEEAEERVREVEKRIRESKLRIEERREADGNAFLLGDRADDVAAENGWANPELSNIERQTGHMKSKVMDAIKAELLNLEPEDALIMQLYFEQGLSAKGVSNTIPGTNEKNIYRRIDKTLKTLRKSLEARGVTKGDIKDIFDTL